MKDLNWTRRDREVDNLLSAFYELEKGKLQIRFVNGEAGSGKSTLVGMFIDEIKPQAAQTIITTGFCNLPSDYNLPYQPFKDLLKQLFEEARQLQETAPTRKETVRNVINFSAQMLLKYAPNLIGSLIPGGSLVSEISQSIIEETQLVEKLQKKSEEPPGRLDESQITEQFIRFVQAFTKEYRLVLVVDNLQWVDIPSVNLMYQMVIALRDCPVLFIGCYRSTDVDIPVNGEKHPLDKLINEVKISQGNVFIQLDQIKADERRTFMNRMLDSEPNAYTSDFRDKLFERTNGNPLFVTELIDLFKEENEIVRNGQGEWVDGPYLDWQLYPVKIEGIIRERIGRLEDSLVQVLSHASVQGYHFIAQVLSRTLHEPEREMLRNLSKKLQKQYHLVTEGECVRLKKSLISRFSFSNYIFQQYLYQELGQTERMLLHEDVAMALEEMYKDHLNEVSNDIAYHYEMAGEYEKAVYYMQLTASEMMRLSAYTKAIPILQKAIGYLQEEAEEESLGDLFELSIRLCVCFRSTKGWGDGETIRAYEIADTYRRRTGDSRYDDFLAFGQWTILMTQLRFQECIDLMENYLESKGEELSVEGKQSAYISLINTYFWMGDFPKTADILGRLESTYPQQPFSRTNQALYHFLKLNISLQTGHLEKSVEEREKIIRQFTAEENRFTQVIIWQAVCWHAFLTGEWDLCREYARKLLDMSQKYSFYYYICIGKMFVGATLPPEEYAKARVYVDEGYAGLDHHKDHKALTHSLYKLIVGMLLFRSGQFDACREVIDEGIETCRAIGEYCYVPQLYLLQGVCNEKQGDRQTAAEAFLTCMEIARQCGAKYPLSQAEKRLSNL